MSEDIEVYPVGFLHDVQRFARNPSYKASRRLLSDLRFPLRRAKKRNWRAVKNYFNGYLAEPTKFPPGVTRCGSGWTKRRALRDYQQRVRKVASLKVRYVLNGFASTTPTGTYNVTVGSVRQPTRKEFEIRLDREDGTN